MFLFVSLFVTVFAGLFVLVFMGPARAGAHLGALKPIHWGTMVGTGALIFLSASLMYWVSGQRRGGIAYVGPLAMGFRVALVVGAGLLLFPRDRPATVRTGVLLGLGVAATLVGVGLTGASMTQPGSG